MGKYSFAFYGKVKITGDAYCDENDTSLRNFDVAFSDKNFPFKTNHIGFKLFFFSLISKRKIALK